MAQGKIHIGIGGWEFAPWRNNFYPKGLPQKDELAYVGEHLTSTEINGTFYRNQTPAQYRAWADAVPKHFVFSVKAQRGAAQRKDAEEAKPSVERFLQSGISELGDKLGAILWQLPAGRKFDHDQLARFLELLPEKQDGVTLRHALEAAHPSFGEEDAAKLLHARNIARVILDKEGVALDETVTADHVYLRLQGTASDHPQGYAPGALDDWATKLKAFAKPTKSRVFAYVIAGAKERAPAAAMGLIERLT